MTEHTGGIHVYNTTPTVFWDEGGVHVYNTTPSVFLTKEGTKEGHEEMGGAL